MKKNEIVAANEDKIKTLLLKVDEVVSFCNIIYCALNNDAEVPKYPDILNSICILLQNMRAIKIEMNEYVCYCEENGIFNNSESVMPKA